MSLAKKLIIIEKNIELSNFDFGNKVLYHPRKIADIFDNRLVYPVNVEIDLSNRCNHRCSFCNCANFPF